MTAGKRFKRLIRDRARRTGESYVSARRALLAKRSENDMTTMDRAAPAGELVEVTVEAVSTEDPAPFVLLRERGGDRRVAVFIGRPEAMAMAFALQGQPTRRPMTHDALKQAVDALGGRVDHIVVGHEPGSSTYTADVAIVLPDGTERHLDWRPSDSIALALRCEPRPAVRVPVDLIGPLPVGRPSASAFPCRSCGAAIPFVEADLTPLADAPGLALLAADCPSCGVSHQKAQIVHLPPAQAG